MLNETSAECDEMDPAGKNGGKEAGYWRSWAERAAPELLEDFNKRSGKAMKAVRATYPANVVHGTGEYQNLRRETVDALNRLAAAIQGEYDAEH